jgi:mono/diheme cytochrome c family protein
MLKRDCFYSKVGFFSSRIILSFSLIFTLFLAVNTASAQDDGIPTDEAIIKSGEKLFLGNCKVCHAVQERVIGPALKDIHKRRDVEWITAFVRNSQKVIKSGDPYAVKLYEEYNKVQMTSFDFEDPEILSIIAYLKAESSKEVVKVDVASADGAAEAGQEEVPSKYLTIIMVGLVIVLLLILVVLGVIIGVLKKYLGTKEDIDEEDKEIVGQKIDLQRFVKSNAFLGIVAFIFTAIVLKSALDGIFTVGVQQGYQPTQPIAFSHKIHAGQYEIDCNYCHTGVRLSKSANIPSPNICMNCHSGIPNVAGKTGVSPEIQKIYNAVETNTPIEWVRVHNLPDLAYFNHSQHVAVGEIECQTCHGPIQEMDVVSQYSPLTMGWCINCHRETDVNTKGNEYYDKLVKLHGETSKNPMKVEDIGGLECSKCHY